VKNQSISRRYAKALLMIGKTDGKADTYKNELNDFAELFATESSLEQVINNPLQ
jgi:F-type H+-transporting ATPase subunit delta